MISLSLFYFVLKREPFSIFLKSSKGNANLKKVPGGLMKQMSVVISAVSRVS